MVEIAVEAAERAQSGGCGDGWVGRVCGKHVGSKWAVQRPAPIRLLLACMCISNVSCRDDLCLVAGDTMSVGARSGEGTAAKVPGIAISLWCFVTS